MEFNNITYKTSPIVLHDVWTGHGIKESDLFNQIKEKLFTQPKKEIGKIDNITIITWNNQEKGTFEKGLDHFGIPYLVLGKGTDKFYKSFKITLTLKALENINTKYVLGADSYDVLLLESPQEVINRFKEFNCKILFNATPTHWPGDIPTKEFEESKSNTIFKFLNSGIYIAETEFLKKLLKKEVELDPPPLQDDQGFFKKKYAKYYPEIQIDSNCKIFQTLNVSEEESKKMFKIE